MQNFCNLVEGNMFKFGVEQRGVGKMSAFQRKSCHLGNGERYSQGYYGSLIGSGYALTDEMKIVDLG